MEEKKKTPLKFKHEKPVEIKPTKKEEEENQEGYVEKRLKEIYEFTDKREKTW